jgi:type IV pilus assembly protein PilA
MKRRRIAAALTCLGAPVIAGIALMLLAASDCPAQTPSSQDSPDAVIEQINSKYPGMMDAIGHLMERMRNEIRYPAPRSESRLLPQLPESTALYLAIPNYGDTAHQAAEILRSEMKDSAVLREAIQKNKEWAELEPKIEDGLEKAAQLQQFLGDEVVVTGDMKGSVPALLAVAQIRKPGLKEYLEKALQEVSKNQKSGVRIFDTKELGSAEVKPRNDELLVLLQDDLVAASSDLDELRKFHAELEQKKKGDAASTAFRKRLGQEYVAGVSMLAGADLHTLMKDLPPIAQRGIAPLRQNGFGDVQYFIWNRKSRNAESIGKAELSFASRRQGAAAWLANSRRLTTPGFVSPKSVMSLTLVLSDPSKIFDDIKVMAGPAQQDSFAALAQFEQILKVSLKDDVLASLSGEVTLELVDVSSTQPVWRAILQVKDAEPLRKTFDTLLAASGMLVEHAEQGGIAYNTLHLGTPVTAESARRGEKPPLREISYALADGHLVIGPGQEAVAEAFRTHRSGESLEKWPGFLARLPEGHGLEGSALLYQDAAAMWNLQLRRSAPKLADSMTKFLGTSLPSVMGVYADDTTIREASRSSGTDVSTMMVVAAIAIPNLLRSRMAANEASAVGSIRTINTAEVTYETVYPKLGFAPTLAKMGPNPADPEKPTVDHADLIDESLASENCTADGWCTKSGYRFHLKGTCKANSCSDYVVTATPVEANRSGARSFCSTSDGIIRMKLAAGTLTAPLAIAECKKWEALR